MLIPAGRRHLVHRLVSLTDAVVAIALTLLVLPLVGAAVDADPDQLPLGVFLDRHLATVGGFLLSFIVILGLWRAHHDLFELLDRVDPVLRWLTFSWVLTIVVTPFTTQLIIAYGSQPLAELLYIGVLLLSSTCQSLTAGWMVRHRELLRSPLQDHPVSSARTNVTTGLFMLALLLALLPGVGYAGLLVLLLARPTVALLHRWGTRAGTR